MAQAHSHGSDAGPPVSVRTRWLLTVAIAPFVVATLVGIVVLWPGEIHDGFAEAVGAPDELVGGRILTVAENPCPGTTGVDAVPCTSARIRLLEGPDEDEVITLMLQTVGADRQAGPGDAVVLSFVEHGDPAVRYSFADFDRRRPLLLLGIAFVGAVIFLGRWQGVRALFGTGVSLAVLIVFVLPAVLEGSSPLAVALTASSLIALVALYLVHGINARTTTAVLGTLVSLALVGVLGAVVVDAGNFTGLASEEAGFLSAFSGEVDLRGLLLGGVVIGALGVLDDVTVTQVSAVWELRKANPDYGRGQLYRSALRIGRDHIASTVNTLVLAYAGASLPLLVLFTQLDQSLDQVVNGEVVAAEVVRTLAGSIGLVASVPLTTALAVAVVTAAPTPTSPSGDPRRFLGRREERFRRELQAG